MPNKKAMKDMQYDITRVMGACQLCTRPYCSDECWEFTKYQIEEICERACSGKPYERIYV